MNPFDGMTEEEGTGPSTALPSATNNPFEGMTEGEETTITPSRPVPAANVASLPAPHPNMFADMEDDDAQAVYDAYIKHPKSQIDQESGDVIYDGVPVPRPEGNGLIAGAFAKAGELIGKPAEAAASLFGLGDEARALNRAAGGGLLNVPRTIISGGLAMADQMLSPGVSEEELRTGVQDQGFLGDAAVAVDQNAPEYNPQGGLEHFGVTGAEVAAGILLGNKTVAALKAAGIGNAAIQGMKAKLPTAVKYFADVLIKATGSAAGTAATVDGTNDTLLVGENKLIEGLQGAEPGTAKRILEDRINVLLDGILIASPLEMAADLGKPAVKFLYGHFLKPIITGTEDIVGRSSMNSQRITDALMDAVAETVDAQGTNPEKAQFWKDTVVKILRDSQNAQVSLDTARTGASDVTLDTAATIRRGIENIDPAAPGNELFNPEDADAVGRLFTEVSKGATEQLPQGGTATAQRSVTKATNDLLETGSESYGGIDAVEDSREGLQNIGEGRVNQAIRGDPTSANQRRLARQDEAFAQSMSGDEFGEKIVKAKDEPFSETFVERNRLTKDILQAEEAGSGAIKDESRELLDAIHPKAQPRKSFEDNLLQAEEGGYLTGEMKKILGEAGVEVDPEGGFSSGSLRMLQRLRAPLRAEIERLREIGSPGATDLQNILDDISNVKGSAGKGALKKYIDFEDQTVSPMTREGLPKELDTIRKANRADLPKKADETASALRGALTGDRPDTVSHLADVLSDERYGKSHGKIAEYIYVDAIDDLRQNLKEHSLSEIDSGPIFSTLKKYRQALTNEKFSGVLKKFDELEKLINTHKKDKKALETILKTKIGDPTAMKDEIYKDILGDFFTSQGIREPNGYESFKRLFLNPQSTGKREAGRLDKIIEMAERDNPIILDGMKSAWLKNFRETVFNAEDQIAMNATKKAISDSSHLMTVGEKLFKGEGDRELLNAVRVGLNVAFDQAKAAKSGSIGLSPVGEAARDARASVSQLVRLVYGPLSRTGTGIGAIWTGILDRTQPKEKAIKLLDAMMKDPEGFISAFDKSQKAWDKRNGREMRDVINWMIKSGVYDDSEGNKLAKSILEANEEQQTEEVFPKEGGSGTGKKPMRVILKDTLGNQN